MKICGDCLANPSMDQRSHAKNGRCRHCHRALARAKRRRAAERSADRADKTYAAVYPMQDVASRDWAV